MQNRNIFFRTPGLEQFIAACCKIESDPNYRPPITDSELLSLIVDENGKCKKSSALVLERSNINALSTSGDSLGMLYHVKEAKWDYIENDFMIRHDVAPSIDTSKVILVNKKGDFSFHHRVDAEKGNFNSPIQYLKINNFLSDAEVNPLKEKIEEIKKQIFCP